MTPSPKNLRFCGFFKRHFEDAENSISLLLSILLKQGDALCVDNLTVVFVLLRRLLSQHPTDPHGKDDVVSTHERRHGRFRTAWIALLKWEV